MQKKLSLCIRVLLLITGGLSQCLALKQITVIQGDTLTLTCPLKNTNMTDVVEWKNPEGLVLFFNKHKGFKDKRIKLFSLTNSEFTIHVKDITFKDGGVYRCMRYNNQFSIKTYKVIVIGAPKLETDEQEDKTTVKCSASANDHPPRLSWLMDNGLEIDAHPYYLAEHASKKYTAVSQLNIKVPKKRVTVKCLVRHTALYRFHLENFVHLGKQNQDTTTSSKYFSTTLGLTDTTIVPRTHFNSTVNETKNSTLSRTTILSNSTANETTELMSETTVITELTTSIGSPSNTTGKGRFHIDTQSNKKENSMLLVLLVTCLTICLLVVLIFFLARLRKAHIAWKKENDESDQSVESSKSKSSNEEKQKQQQRREGCWNTSFTKYKAEETAENAVRTTPDTIQVISESSHNVFSTSGIRETEL